MAEDQFKNAVIGKRIDKWIAFTLSVLGIVVIILNELVDLLSKFGWGIGKGQLYLYCGISIMFGIVYMIFKK